MSKLKGEVGVTEGVVVGSLCCRMAWNEGPFCLGGALSRDFFAILKRGKECENWKFPSLGEK